MADRKLYNAHDLKAFLSLCRSTVKELDAASEADVGFVFYWILRGRPLAEIGVLYPTVDMDAVVFPLIKSYYPAMTTENCEQLIADRATRHRIAAKIKTAQQGAQFYNLNVVDKDPSLLWECLDNSDGPWTVKIQPVSPNERKSKPDPSPRIIHRRSKQAEKNGSGLELLPNASSVSVRTTQTSLSKTIPQGSQSLRQVRYEFASAESATSRRLNLSDFLRSAGCTNFADAVRAVCGEIGVPDCIGDVLNNFTVRQGSTIRSTGMGSIINLTRFKNEFSRCFTVATTPEIAVTRIFNVVNSLNRAEKVDESPLGYTRRSIPSELAPGGESIQAVRTRNYTR